MNGNFWGVEAVPCEIMAKHRFLRQMSDFDPISDDEVTFSRPSPPNHENHLHHDLPMDPTDGLNGYIWGVEPISQKITAENHNFADFRFRTPSAADFVLS